MEQYLPISVERKEGDCDDTNCEKNCDDDQGCSFGGVSLAAVARQELGPRQTNDVRAVAANAGQLGNESEKIIVKGNIHFAILIPSENFIESLDRVSNNSLT